MDAHTKLTKARNAVCSHKRLRALAGFILSGETKIVSKEYLVARCGAGTAATDGVDTFFAEEFIDTLNPRELAFVVAHEAAHKGLQHMSRYDDMVKANAALANIAMDFVINGILAEADKNIGKLEMPKSALYDAKFDGMSTVQVFNELRKMAKGGKGGGGKGAGKPMDGHIFGRELTKSEKEELARLGSGSKLIGNLSGGGERNVLASEERRDWREILREWLTEMMGIGSAEASWRSVSRRTMAHGYTLPASMSPALGHVVVGVDTSGSISQDDLSKALGDIAGVLSSARPVELWIMYWDTKVCRVERYKPEQYGAFTSSTKPAGGGGTDGRALEQWFLNNKHEPHPSVVIQFTDGYVGKWGTGLFADRTMWVVSTNEVPPWGKRVQAL